MLWLCSKKWRSANTMTTQILTNNILANNGLPDEAALAKLANAMFSAIPGVLEKAGILNAANVQPAPLGELQSLPVPQRFEPQPFSVPQALPQSTVPQAAFPSSVPSFYFLDAPGGFAIPAYGRF